MNLPVIALCDSDSPLQYVDIPIPCGNRSTESISMIYWLLAREIKYLKGELALGTTLKYLRRAVGRFR